VRKIEATAYHEAGHAVAAFLLFRAVKRISIVPDDETSGPVEHYPIRGTWFQPDVEIDMRARRHMETSITLLLAGPSAERKATGRWNRVGASGDIDAACDLALRLVGSERQFTHYWAWRRQIALDLWEDEHAWGLAQRLTVELLERKKMSGREAREVLLLG
jgi:hypothetical protein